MGRSRVDQDVAGVATHGVPSQVAPPPSSTYTSMEMVEREGAGELPLSRSLTFPKGSIPVKWFVGLTLRPTKSTKGELRGMALTPLNPTQKFAPRITSWIFFYESESARCARAPQSTPAGKVYNLLTWRIQCPPIDLYRPIRPWTRIRSMAGAEVRYR